MTDIIVRPLARPPFDPELAAALALLGETLPPTLTPEMIPFMRQAPLMTLDENLLAEREITRRDITIRGYDGDDILIRREFLPAEPNFQVWEQEEVARGQVRRIGWMRNQFEA